jgi:hypothetical protein
MKEKGQLSLFFFQKGKKKMDKAHKWQIYV